MDEENDLNHSLDHFSLTTEHLDRNGVLAQTVKAAVIRDVAEGVVPQRQTIHGSVPYNLMTSEKLVWQEETTESG